MKKSTVHAILPWKMGTWASDPVFLLSGYTYYEVNLCDERNSSLEGMTVYVKRVCAYAWKHTHCHLPRVWTFARAFLGNSGFELSDGTNSSALSIDSCLSSFVWSVLLSILFQLVFLLALQQEQWLAAVLLVLLQGLCCRGRGRVLALILGLLGWVWGVGGVLFIRPQTPSLPCLPRFFKLKM